MGQSNEFHTAVAAGNLTMARAAFAFSQKRGGAGGLAPASAPGAYEFGQSRMGGMNQLHADVLAADGKAISYKFKSISVTKKAGGNHALTPVHLAAINPDVQYLKALADVLGVQALLATTDDSNRGAGPCTPRARVRACLAETKCKRPCSACLDTRLIGPLRFSVSCSTACHDQCSTRLRAHRLSRSSG